MALNMNIVAFILVECRCAVLNRELPLDVKHTVESLPYRERIGVCFLSSSLLFASIVLCPRDFEYGACPWQREHKDIWSLLNSPSWVGFSGI